MGSDGELHRGRPGPSGEHSISSVLSFRCTIGADGEIDVFRRFAVPGPPRSAFGGAYGECFRGSSFIQRCAVDPDIGRISARIHVRVLQRRAAPSHRTLESVATGFSDRQSFPKTNA